MSYKIITISRQFACGGSEIGKKLADRLGIKCYDREIISKVAEESGLCEKFVEENPDAAALFEKRPGLLRGPRGPGAAAVLRHSPAGHQPHRPRSDGAVRLPFCGADRAGGGLMQSGGYRGERRHFAAPCSAGVPKGPAF